MDNPFEYGASYRVRKDFEAERDQFRAGEEMVYWRHATSHYDGMEGWFFKQPGRIRSWDVPLGGGQDWAEHFERIADPHPLIVAAGRGDAEAVSRLVDAPPLTVELALEAAVAGKHAAVIAFLGTP